MTTYCEFCRLRDLHIPGVNAPKHTEADAFFMASAQMAVPDGYKLAPLEPTPEIIASAAVAIWPTASPADIALARLATPIVLMQMDMAPGTTADAVAGMLATMAPAYRAMLAAAPIPPAGAESFQFRVRPWMLATFGPGIPTDRDERNHRFLEESLELVQSCGCTASEAHQLVDYVFGRPVGERAQEVGGVMVTLAALCLAQGLDMHAAGETELARIWTKVDAIRAKQAAKPRHSPLPAAAPQVVADERASFENWFMRDRSMLVAPSMAENWPDHDRTYEGSAVECCWQGWQARATLAAAPVQAQEPVAIGAPDPEAVFAAFCEVNGYPSDSEMDEPLRKAFYEGIGYCSKGPFYPAPVQPVAVPSAAKPIAPEICPITGRKFWGNVDHPERGLVATYGGPSDTYSIPYLSDDNELRVERFDQDAGDWVEGGEPCGWYSYVQLEAAPAEQRDAKNAERYRWLRYGDNDEVVLQRGPVDPSYVYLPRNEKLDAMIDAAIAAKAAS